MICTLTKQTIFRLSVQWLIRKELTMKKQLLILAGLSTLLLGACGNEQPAEETTQQPAETEQPSKEIPKVNLGDTFESEDGSYKLTLTQATRDKNFMPSFLVEGNDPTNQFDADNTVVLNFEYENVAVDDGLAIEAIDFQTFDSNGKQLDITEFADGTQGGDTVAVGRTGKVTVLSSLPKDEDKIEADFAPENKALATFTAKVD